MASRPAILATLLGASIGVPYVVSNATGERGAADLAAKEEAAGNLDQARPALSMLNQSGVVVAPTYPLAEVLRMDVSKQWVYSHWPRKSTGLSDPDLFGIRVPLVTGTRPMDLAGSLTYYFDTRGVVQKISFRGRTGDTTQLVELLARRYNFQRQPPVRPGEQLYQVKWNGRIQSELRTLPDSVLWSNSPHKSFAVELDLLRPGSDRYVERPAPPLPLPENVAARPDPPQPPVAVGPVSLFQRINNRITGHGDAPLEGEKPKKKSSKANDDEKTSSPEPVPAKVPRPQVRWPN